jgi:hypothetical protein
MKFSSFLEAINGALATANDQLMNRQQTMLETYFVTEEGDADQQGNKSLATLQPKSVVLKFPQQTESGMTMLDVTVPLITLVPPSFSKVESLRLSANFDLRLNGEELEIELKENSPVPTDDKEKTCRAGHIDITLTPAAGPEGVRQIIESYEKSLRAQLPH